ncbi:MAG: DUF5667 domain-containing protein [Methanoregula sp.]
MKRISGMLVTLVALVFLCIAVIPVAAADTSINTTVPTTEITVATENTTITTAVPTTGTTVAAEDTLVPRTEPINATVEPYNGAIGPGSPLYGFKIALENVDESFTLNQSEKLAKEIQRTELRLAELKSALAANETDAANRTLDLYWQKLNQTEDTLDQMGFNDTGNISAPKVNGLENAWANLNRHKVIFQNLTLAYPNHAGLARAYNNSLERELKFEEKIQKRISSGQNNGKKYGNGLADGINQSETANWTGIVTPPQGANQSRQQSGDVGKGNGNPHNQTNQDQQQTPANSHGQGQQNINQQGNQKGNDVDNNAAGSKKNSDRQDSGSNNGNGAGNGNSNRK